jgi:hypothetical protein
MLPDCIDPEVGDLLRDMASKTISECIAACGYEDVGIARLHWNSCPACRHQFVSMPSIIRQIGLEMERMFAADLSELAEDFAGYKRALLDAPTARGDAYTSIIVRLLEAYEDVHAGLAHANHLTPAIHGVAADWPSDDRPLLFHCKGFLRSLAPRVRQFVTAVTLCYEILKPMYEKVGFDHNSGDELRSQLHTAIVESGLEPGNFVITMESAAAFKIYFDYFGGEGSTSDTPIVQTDKPHKSSTREKRITPQSSPQEWKQDFDNAIDSLKATQMETIRLIEHNQRPAAAYEADIEAQFGAPLYLRLSEMTQRVLQVAEHVYHINQEPNYFHGPVIHMALAYENELAIRIIWPFLSELQASGEQTYDAQGESHEPLLHRGKVPSRCMKLGNFAWYLKNDPVMRSKISALGFDVETVAKDAASVNSLRNKAAHEDVCERAVADELRRRMLCRDGIFSRLHPMVGVNGGNIRAIES